MPDDKTIARSPVSMGDRGVVLSDMDSLQRYSAMVAASPFAPRGFDATAIAVAIDYGASLGMRPLQSLQNIAVINGRPALWGDGMLAIVRSSGLCQWIKEGIENKGTDRAFGWCETHRVGEPDPVRREFSVAEAKAAGLFGKPGPWQQYGNRMLMLRARGFCLRDVYSDVLRGMIMAEEARDIQAERASTLDARIVDTTHAAVEDGPAPEIEVKELPPIDPREIDAAAELPYGAKP